MENNAIFRYRYSAKQNREVERIRNKYLPKEVDKLALLRKLDLRVQTAGRVESLCLGVVGVLLFGIGMCFGLNVWSGADGWTLFFGALGTAVMLPAYPVFRRVAKKTKEKLAPEILRLSDELMNDL